MAASITLHREKLVNTTKGYKVLDRKQNTVGYLASKEAGRKRLWGYVYLTSELKREPNIYRYASKKLALSALILARFSRTETGPIKIIG